MSSWAYNEYTVEFCKSLIAEFPCTLDYADDLSIEEESNEKNKLKNKEKMPLNVCLKQIPIDKVFSALSQKVIFNNVFIIFKL